MPMTFLRSRYQTEAKRKKKTKFEPEMVDTLSQLPMNLQIFKQKLLSENRFVVYK